MRVPLSTFAQKVKVSGGDTNCNIFVGFLSASVAQSNNILMGGMFFQEFFGIFQNDYASITTCD
jgi:hypothetical protein